MTTAIASSNALTRDETGEYTGQYGAIALNLPEIRDRTFHYEIAPAPFAIALSSAAIALNLQEIRDRTFHYEIAPAPFAIARSSAAIALNLKERNSAIAKLKPKSQ